MTAREKKRTATLWAAIVGAHRDCGARPMPEDLLRLQVMTNFDAKFRNLAQAAAWVVYREPDLVEQLANADEAAFTAIGLYPTMWPPAREEHLPLSALHDALSEGRLTSEGYHRDRSDELARIPALDRNILDLHPPLAFNRRHPGKRQELWTEIRVASADVKRLWRSLMETSGRTRFDWVAIRELYETARARNPGFTLNQLIEEVQPAFQQTYGKEPPGRSTIQNHLKQWTTCGWRGAFR